MKDHLKEKLRKKSRKNKKEDLDKYNYRRNREKGHGIARKKEEEGKEEHFSHL